MIDTHWLQQALTGISLRRLEKQIYKMLYIYERKTELCARDAHSLVLGVFACECACVCVCVRVEWGMFASGVCLRFWQPTIPETHAGVRRPTQFSDPPRPPLPNTTTTCIHYPPLPVTQELRGAIKPPILQTTGGRRHSLKLVSWGCRFSFPGWHGAKLWCDHTTLHIQPPHFSSSVKILGFLYFIWPNDILLFAIFFQRNQFPLYFYLCWEYYLKAFL